MRAKLGGIFFFTPCVSDFRAETHVLALASSNCEREDVVVGDEAPLGGVAQVVSHGVKVVGVHGEEGKEKDEEVRVEVKGEVSSNSKRNAHHGWYGDGVMDSRTT